jgi:hypothetical protein
MQHRLAARPRTNGSLSVMTSGAKPYRHQCQWSGLMATDTPRCRGPDDQ